MTTKKIIKYLINDSLNNHRSGAITMTDVQHRTSSHEEVITNIVMEHARNHPEASRLGTKFEVEVLDDKHYYGFATLVLGGDESGVVQVQVDRVLFNADLMGPHENINCPGPLPAGASMPAYSHGPYMVVEEAAQGPEFDIGAYHRAQAERDAERLGAALAATNPSNPFGHYFKDVRALAFIDVYRVLVLFGVTDPCIQHAVKKLLVAGGRGAKDKAKDVRGAIVSLERWVEMRSEDEYAQANDIGDSDDDHREGKPDAVG